MKEYDKMLDISKDIRYIERAMALLAWDERTYMPQGAVKGRSETKGYLSKLHHKKLTSDKVKKILDELNKPSNYGDLDEVQKANVREMTRDFERAYNIPEELVEKLSKAASEGQAAWQKARENSDFEAFLPYLEKNIELQKEAAEYIGYENEPYDALLDNYDPGMTAERVKDIFGPMKKKLSKIVDKMLEQDMKPGEGVFEGKKFPAEKQQNLCKKIAEDIGYDFSQGRIDESSHPFTIGMDDDVRITNRYDEETLSSMFSLIHESGHAMYEQGLDPEHYGTPIGQYVSMGYHESQSRMWENFVGRSRAFMDYLFPKLTDHFPDLKDHSKEEFYNRINRVEPSFIRVEADEVTYNLHIALRYDIELGLFRDEIEASETEVIWQNKMDEYFDIVPEDPAKGVLQDIHWSAGQFGYFPSYALGNLIAAQLFHTIQDEVDDVYGKISNGEFSPLLNWLRENIHNKGRKYLAPELTKQLTGEEIKADYHIDYIKDKFYPIYGL